MPHPTKATQSLTLTRFDIGGIAYRTRAAAERDALRRATLTAADIAEVTHTYRVGDQVMVHAFGKWRRGEVTGLGTRRVTVKYSRNADDYLAERSFGAGEIRPRPTN